MSLLPRRHFLATSALFLGIASGLVPLVALAEGNDAEAQRLAQKRAAERYSVEVPGASLRAGGAAIFVDAPLAVVRKVVTEYSKYASYIPRFQKSKVIAKKDKKTDVYLQVPILNGAATVWSLTRFEPPVKEGTNGERIEGKMLEGNVDDMRGWFHLRPVDENHTILKLELLIALKLPLPGKVVTPELEFASDQAVTAIRDRSEDRHKHSSKDASAKRLSPPSLASVSRRARSSGLPPHPGSPAERSPSGLIRRVCGLGSAGALLGAARVGQRRPRAASPRRLLGYGSSVCTRAAVARPGATLRARDVPAPGGAAPL